MPHESSAIPLADALRAANELVSAGLIEDYALGGALAAICYTEPVTTYDGYYFYRQRQNIEPPESPRSMHTCNPKAGASSASIC